LEHHDLQAKYQSLQVDFKRNQDIDHFLKEQTKNMESVILAKNQDVENLQREKAQQKLQLEERIVTIQLQLQQYKQDLDSHQMKIKSLLNEREEKETVMSSNKEMIVALQSRIIELEPQFLHLQSTISDLQSHLQATKVLKMEQDSKIASFQNIEQLLSTTKEQLQQRTRELSNSESRNSQLVSQLQSAQDALLRVQSEIEEKTAMITRLRTEAQANERNHAMRTAMLATCEAQVEELQQQIVNNSSAMNQMDLEQKMLQTSLSSAQQQHDSHVHKLTEDIEALKSQLKAKELQSQQDLHTYQTEQLLLLETMKKDFSKKSTMARQLLSEREDEVKLLSSKVGELQDEISSGTPTERKIFELAKEQSKRDAQNVLYR
jgi:chromosome segregation ATPase